MAASTPSPKVIVREYGGRPFYEAKFFHQGRQVKCRIGPAWLERDHDAGGWRKHHKRRVPNGTFDEARAYVRATEIVSEYIAAEVDAERIERERVQQSITFREVAHAYLEWLETVRGAKPATLRDHRYVLSESGVPYKRGKGTTAGHVMAALGDPPAAQVTTREVEALLSRIGDSAIGKQDEGDEPARKMAPRTINKYRAVISAVFNYGCKPSTFALLGNPANEADKRREPHPGVLVYYTPEEVEAIGKALEKGEHRDPSRPAVTPEEIDAQRAEDHQDAELVRVGYYTGLRMGELLALRWRNVDFANAVLKFDRAISAGVESTTKTGRIRIVPLSDQAAAALERVAAMTSRAPRTSCSATPTAAALTTPRCAVATSAPAPQRASSRCVSTTCATPSAPTSQHAALTSSRSRKRWGTQR